VPKFANRRNWKLLGKAAFKLLPERVKRNGWNEWVRYRLPNSWGSIFAFTWWYELYYLLVEMYQCLWPWFSSVTILKREPFETITSTIWRCSYHWTLLPFFVLPICWHFTVSPFLLVPTHICCTSITDVHIFQIFNVTYPRVWLSNVLIPFSLWHCNAALVFISSYKGNDHLSD